MNKIEDLKKTLSKEGYNVKTSKELKSNEKILTDNFILDYIIDGGIGKKHRIEFWGKESSGKSLFALLTVKKYQELGKVCVWIDVEHSIDLNWCDTLGVDIENLIVVSPESLEQAGDLMYNLLLKNVDLIVIDSIISLIPEAELERDTDQPTIALNAKINALICKKIYAGLSKSDTSMIFINQIREKVGVMYGNPETTSGGKALLHLYDTRVNFRPGKPIEQGTGDKKEKIGIEINIKCNKNKRGIPQRKGVVDFYFTGKLDNNKSLFFIGLKYGIINLSGKTYTYKKTKIVGKDNFINEFKDWKALEKEIWEKIKK